LDFLNWVAKQCLLMRLIIINRIMKWLNYQE
jgi:hypothetical protein